MSIFDILKQAYREVANRKACDKPQVETGLTAFFDDEAAKKAIQPALPASDWKPTIQDKNVVVVIDASVGRLGVLRQATQLVEQLYADGHIKREQLKTKIMWFMDDCMHSTKWGSSPSQVGDATRGAHCYQGRTRFADALNACKDKAVDAVLILGDRCDDTTTEVRQAADNLRKDGTKIFAFNIGDNPKAAEGYQAMADVYLPLRSEDAIGEVITPVIDHLFRGSKALEPLARSGTTDQRLLAGKLALLDPADKIK